LRKFQAHEDLDQTQKATMARRTFFNLAKITTSMAVLAIGFGAASCAVAEDDTEKEAAKQSPSTVEADPSVKNNAPVAQQGEPRPKAHADHDAVSAEVPEPADYRTNDYRSPVPATLKGARVIDGEEAHELVKDNATIFIDVYPRAPKPPNLPKNTVWRDPVHMSIKGAQWLPNVGYGVLAAHVETYFKTHLARLTGGDKTKPVAFFCLKDCWMSWNAGKRAVEWGYTSVIWFSEGTDGWQESGGNLSPIKAIKD